MKHDRRPVAAVTVTFHDGTQQTYHGLGHMFVRANSSHPGERPQTSWWEVDAHLRIDSAMNTAEDHVLVTAPEANTGTGTPTSLERGPKQ